MPSRRGEQVMVPPTSPPNQDSVQPVPQFIAVKQINEQKKKAKECLPVVSAADWVLNVSFLPPFGMAVNKARLCRKGWGKSGLFVRQPSGRYGT